MSVTINQSIDEANEDVDQIRNKSRADQEQMQRQGTLSFGFYVALDSGPHRKKESPVQRIPLGIIGSDKQAQSVLPRTPSVN